MPTKPVSVVNNRIPFYVDEEEPLIYGDMPTRTLPGEWCVVINDLRIVLAVYTSDLRRKMLALRCGRIANDHIHFVICKFRPRIGDLLFIDMDGTVVRMPNLFK